MDREKTEEYIICAAIHYDDGEEHVHQPVDTGFVIGGWRHHNCIATLSAIMGKKNERMGEDIDEIEGFITSHGRFVEREEAADIALRSGQIKDNKERLFSEDLYTIYK